MKIVLFDIDGTLLVTNRAGSTAMHAALAEEFGVTEPALVDFAGRTDRGIIGDFFRHHAVQDTEENVARFVAAYLRRLPSALAAQRGRVLPGVNALIDLLAGRDDVAVGLLTGNLERGARHKLSHFELDTYFAFGGFGDTHRERNDVARAALRAAEAHAAMVIEPSRVIVIGDTQRDIFCARSIGARAVAVATGSDSRERLAGQQPDLLIDDLSDPSVIVSLLASC